MPSNKTKVILFLRNLGNNQIASLENSPFQNTTRLQDLTLSHNSIPYIGSGSFKGLRKLEYL